DADDVARGELPAAWDAVDDLVVDRGADARGEALVALELGRRAPAADDPLGLGIDLGGRHAGAHVLARPSEHERDDPAGLAHRDELLVRLDADHLPPTFAAAAIRVWTSSGVPTPFTAATRPRERYQATSGSVCRR